MKMQKLRSRPILEANPSIEVAIDLHRDGVAETTHLVTQINGKPTAQDHVFQWIEPFKNQWGYHISLQSVHTG